MALHQASVQRTKLDVNPNHTFQLEPISPEDRAYRQAERRKSKSEAMARARAEERAAGVTQMTFSVELEHLAKLDALKELRGFRSRSQAFALIMTTLASNPKVKKELGL